MFYVPFAFDSIGRLKTESEAKEKFEKDPIALEAKLKNIIRTTTSNLEG